jgi:hypothetical protein
VEKLLDFSRFFGITHPEEGYFIMEKSSSSYIQTPRVRAVLKSTKFHKYKGLSSKNAAAVVESNYSPAAAGKGYESGDSSTSNRQNQKIPKRVNEKRDESDSVQLASRDTKLSRKESRDDVKKHTTTKEGMESKPRMGKIKSTQSQSKKSLIQTHDDSADLRLKFMKAVEKRSTKHYERSDNATSSRPNSQQQRNQSPPILTSYISKPKEGGMIKGSETSLESYLDLRKVLQSNKSISPATIESILAIEYEARKELDSEEYTSFQQELSKQNMEKNQDNFHDKSYHPNMQMMQNDTSGINIVVLGTGNPNQREKAKEIIAKRKLGTFSNTYSEQLKALSQASLMSNLNRSIHAPSNQSYSYRSFVPDRNVSYGYQPRMIINNPFPVALGRPYDASNSYQPGMVVNNPFNGPLGGPAMIHDASNIYQPSMVVNNPFNGALGRPVMNHDTSNSYQPNMMVNKPLNDALGRPVMNHDTSNRTQPNMMVHDPYPAARDQPLMNHDTSNRTQPSLVANDPRPAALDRPVMYHDTSNRTQPNVVNDPRSDQPVMNHDTSNRNQTIMMANDPRPAALDQPLMNHDTSNRNQPIMTANDPRPAPLDQPLMNHDISNRNQPIMTMNDSRPRALGHNISSRNQQGMTANDPRPAPLDQPVMNHNTSNRNQPIMTVNGSRPRALGHNTSSKNQQDMTANDSRPAAVGRPVMNRDTSNINISGASCSRPNYVGGSFVDKQAMSRLPSKKIDRRSLSPRPLVTSGRKAQQAKSPVTKSSPPNNRMSISNIMSRMDKAYLSLSRPFVPNDDTSVKETTTRATVNFNVGSRPRSYSRSYSFTSSSSGDTTNETSGSESREISYVSSIS